MTPDPLVCDRYFVVLEQRRDRTATRSLPP